MKISKILILALLLLIPSTSFAHVAFKRADKYDKFHFQVEAGTTLNHEIRIINTTSTPIDAKIYATDGAISSSGGYTVLSRNQEQINVGKWTTILADEIIHLEGNEEKIIPFKIEIPANTTPGVYGGGLSAEPTIERSKLENGAGAIISTRIVQQIYVDIPGEKIVNYEWNNFSYFANENHNFSLNFKNKGNTIIKIKGEIEIKDIFGNKTKIPMSEVTLLNGKESSTKVEWQEKPFLGIYTAKANLKFHELDMQQNSFIEIGTQTKEISFTIIPWTTLIITLLFIVALLTLFILKKRSYKSYLKKCVQYSAKEGDSIKIIATNNNISWKKLAKMNKLKAPYEIGTGQKIIVPPKK